MSEWTDQSIDECWDEDTKDFDWNEYQYLCDIAEYWDMD